MRREKSINQIRLIQTAVRAAGIRTKEGDGRYLLLLGKYTQRSRKPVTSCKQLTQDQVDDLLAICEACGWKHPDHPADYYQRRVADAERGVVSVTQIEMIRLLQHDLGWTGNAVKAQAKRMSGGRTDDVYSLSRTEAGKVIEAMKSICFRNMGIKRGNLKDLQEALSTDCTD